MAEGKLKRIHKVFIVQQLAMFERPSIVRRELKEIYGLDVALPAILNYDPTKPSGSKKWQQLFDDTRADFIKDTSTIAIANKAVRLRELDRLFEKQKLRPDAQQNTVEMRATLEQAAKESGGHFTNRQELTGKGGKPLIPDKATVVVYLPDNGRGDGRPAVKTPAADDPPGDKPKQA